MLLAVASTSDAGSTAVGVIVLLVILAFWVAAFVWFFKGPMKAADRYAETLSQTFTNADDQALFLQLYRQKGAKSVLGSWLLTVFLSPTVSYLYQASWMKALLSFITIQGLGIWYVVAVFTMPFEVINRNKQAADDALLQLRIMRPNLPHVQAPPAPATA